MATPSDVSIQSWRKGRHNRYIHFETCTGDISKPTNSFLITVLLVAFAVVAQGESRTLRHYRRQQDGDAADLNNSLINPRIEEQQIIRKVTEAANEYPDAWSHDNNNGESIISSLFDGSDEKQVGETHHYSIGQYSDNKSRSIRMNDKFQKLVPSISIQTAEIGESNSFSNGTIDYSNISIYSVGKKESSDHIVKNLSDKLEERFNYEIGGGEKEKPHFQSQERDPICRDCHTMSDGSVCTVSDYECCSNDDCIDSDEVCSHRNCIINEYFRFTLKWIGDDDLDLFVVTPDGAEISYDKEFDPASLGKFEKQADQKAKGYHLENIYFPMEGGPSGVYRFYVHPYIITEESDVWTVTVTEAGNVVAFESGVGSSGSFFCKKNEPRPTKLPIPSPIQHPIKSPAQNPIKSPTLKPTVTTPTIPIPVEFPVRPPLGQTTKVPVSLPAPIPTASTEPPQSNDNDGCDTAGKDECCVSSDCENDKNICEQRTCIKTGNPRFTLKWYGYNYMDMFVITPDGVTLSQANTFDVISGGTFERETNDQASFEYRVQNIYFPIEDSPGGTYEYGVRYNNENGVATMWTVESYNEDGLSGSDTGSGNSKSFTYFHRNDLDGPQRPQHPPQACSLQNDECCINDDCARSTGDLCIQRTCISDGSLRITLEWTGNDNLHLFVSTPSNTTISNNEEFDIVSGGHHESSKQSIFGFNIESVYFPSSGAPIGSYKIIVDTSAIEGIGADLWRIRIYEGGEIKLDETRSGDSTIFSYDVKSPNMDDSGLCKFDSACADDSSQVCVRGACIRDGNPRFTMRWPGGSFYSLSVITPDGAQISAFAPFDADSRGIFEGPTQHHKEGDDVESVYFPVEGGPIGMYSYFVTNSGGGNTDEPWIVTVHVDGESVSMETGFGNSNLFSFQFGGFTEDEDPYKPLPLSCDKTSKCLMPNSICILQICVEQGTPQFVLSWSGDSDFTISVVTPLKTILSLQNPSDVQSGGKFEKYNITNDSNRYIERIYFSPEQGPTGLYPFQIKSNDNKGDVWNVAIFVDGKEIESHSGQGTSDLKFFNYKGDISVAEPTDIPAREPPDIPVQEHPDTPAAEPPDFPVQEPPDTPVAEPPDFQVQEPPDTPVAEPEKAPRSMPFEAATDQEPCNRECCVNADCSFAQICSRNTCVKKGSPQFLLAWEGDYDIALLVVTPVKSIVSWQDPIDLASGGRFEQYIDFVNNRCIENIYFAPNNELRGIYPYYIHSFATDAVDDTWTVTIYIDGIEIETEIGKGSSEMLFFEYTGDLPEMDSTMKPTMKPAMKPTMKPTIKSILYPEAADGCEPFVVIDGETLAVTNGECCSDANCFPNESCTSRTCVDEGNPRFTLSWTGANDLDLLVVTPLGTIISYSKPEDSLSGGKFGEDYNQFEYGLHVENIYFPVVSDKAFDGYGEYSFYVRKALGSEIDDKWTVGVYVNGEEQLSVSGTGNSKELKYSYSITFFL